MKRVRFEMCNALANEHIRKNLVSLRRTDTDTMPHQQSLGQRMFKRLVKDLVGIHFCMVGLTIDYQGYME